MEQYEVKREFTTIDDAFLSLPAPTQAQCVRVAEYAEALFVQACASDIYPDNAKVQALLDPEFAQTIKATAQYAAIGKALVPALYHTLQADFTEEEIALYRKFPADGAKFAEPLLAERFGKRGARTVATAIAATQERWDGAGYPAATAAEDIPFVARLVAVAAAIDEFAVQKLSEKPFEYAVEKVKALSGIALDPAIVQVVAENRAKMKKVFTKFINQSRAIPTTECFIRRRASRPYALFYRPIAAKGGKTMALEAAPYFKDEKTWAPAATVEHIIKKEGIAPDLMLYFMTELCDTLQRTAACGLAVEYIAIDPLPTFLNRRGLDKALQQTFDMVGVAAAQVCVMVQAEHFATASKTMLENIRKLSAMGCGVMLSGVTLQTMPITEQPLHALGFTHLRLVGGLPKEYEDTATNEALQGLAQHLQLMVADLNKKHQTHLMGRNGITAASGLLYGADFISEDAMIESELNAKETKLARFTPLLQEAEAAAAEQAAAAEAEKAAAEAEKAAAEAEKAAEAEAAEK